MANMIPPTINPDVKSSAERKIYQWLENLEWKNCVVLHSLGIANHSNNIFGEIDFVIISHEGILCIEVKGGHVYRKAGKWYFMNRFGQENSKHVGPFEQVQGNMHSLRAHMKKLVDKTDALFRCQYACCVMTPDCIIEENSVDIIQEILFDCRDKKENLALFFEKSMEYWRNQCISKHGFEGGKLNDEDIIRAVKIMRGDFKFVPSLSVLLNRTDEQLLTATEEQYEIMQGFNDNERLFISGAAGTGKTLLALEQCRRLSATGKKVLYLCFNKLLALYIANYRDGENGDYDVYNFHKLMMEMCNVYTDENNYNFFKNDLPAMFLEKYENGEIRIKYDAVIIDEGQDLMNKHYYCCVDNLIRGGFSEGLWTVYLDPNQNIFNDNDEFDFFSKKIKKDAESSYTLTRNCRNTYQIAVANQMISNIPQARQIGVKGSEVEYISYLNKADELAKLIRIIRNLRAQGIAANDIVILSPVEKTSCLAVATIPSDIGPIRINPRINNFDRKSTDFYTIQSYKGLEAKVVILIDIENFESKQARLLNYVAVSRARTLLYVLYNEDVENERQKMLLQGALMYK